jgi:hypothetical protein
MTLHGQVTARIDSLERQARRALGWTGRIRGWRGRNVEIDAQWTVGVWVPSLKRRAERHQHDSGLRPCPDYRDLCAELGINPEETT